MSKTTVDFAKLSHQERRTKVPEGSGGGMTSGDETGARAERLRTVLREVRAGMGCERLDAEFLVAEMDRVTADRFRSERDDALARAETAIGELRRIEALSEVAQCLYDGDVAGAVETALEQISAERDAAIASRNAWAEKCAGLREALEACHNFLGDPEGFAGVTISDTVWVRDGMTLKDWVEGALAATEPKP